MLDVVKLCAVFLRLEDVLTLPELGGTIDTEDFDEIATRKELNNILRCANLVCAEVASEYFPLKTQQFFVTNDGKIPFDDFLHSPIDIHAVSVNEKKCSFKIYPSEVITDTGKVLIDYTYLPENVALNGELDYSEGKLHSRTIAYGTASEYCLISGMYEEALIWDKRYKDSLINTNRTLRSFKLPKRRWI